MPDQWYAPLTPARLKPWPWLHPDATLYLNSLLNPEMELLEHGAGGSTLWLAERVRHVTSVESSIAWYDAVRARKPANATLLLSHDVVFISPVDLLFIDGEPIENRAKWLDAVPRLVKPGGYVILDNSNRPEYASARAYFQTRAQLLNTVDGNAGGTLHLITEFHKWLG